MTRLRLPNRRSHQIQEFLFRNQKFTMGCAHYHDGRPAEIFIDCVKASSQSADDARDIAVCLSIAFQHGIHPNDIREALTRESNGSPAGLAGAVLDRLAEEIAYD